MNYYFHRFITGNPFGFAALNIKALYMEPRVVAGQTRDRAKLQNISRPSATATTMLSMTQDKRRNCSDWYVRSAARALARDKAALNSGDEVKQ